MLCSFHVIVLLGTLLHVSALDVEVSFVPGPTDGDLNVVDSLSVDKQSIDNPTALLWSPLPHESGKLILSTLAEYHEGLVHFANTSAIVYSIDGAVLTAANSSVVPMVVRVVVEAPVEQVMLLTTEPARPTLLTDILEDPTVLLTETNLNIVVCDPGPRSTTHPTSCRLPGDSSGRAIDVGAIVPEGQASDATAGVIVSLDEPLTYSCAVDVVNRSVVVDGPSTSLALASLCVNRLESFATLARAGSDVLRTNEDRLTEAQWIMFQTYLFVAIVAFMHAILFGIVLSWWWSPFVCCAIKPPRWSPSWSTIIWPVLASLILSVAIALGGITGLFVVGFIFSVLMIVLFVWASRAMRAQLAAALDRGAGADGVVTETELHESSEAVGRFRADKSEQSMMAVTPKTIRRLILFYFFVLTLHAIVTVLSWAIWEVDDLRLWDRLEGAPIVEYIPQLTAKSLLILYAWPSVATNLRMAMYVDVTTQGCGTVFTKELTGSEKETEIKEAFIDKYSINMSEYEPSDYTKYTSVNDWFIRPIRDEARPLAAVGREDVIVSPADCRMLVFDDVADSRVWIKGGMFTARELLDDVEGTGVARDFEHSHMVIARLAPQDYHRFNMPLDGELVHYKAVSSTYWSVSKDAATSANYAFYNERKVMIFDNPLVGRFAYVAIGATCVGSVQIGNFSDNRDPSTFSRHEEGTFLRRGQEVGNMQFGGSTVILLFQRGTIRFDDDILYASSLPVESYVHVRDRIGHAEDRLATSGSDDESPLAASSERTVNVGLSFIPVFAASVGAVIAIIITYLVVWFFVHKYTGKGVKVEQL